MEALLTLTPAGWLALSEHESMSLASLGEPPPESFGTARVFVRLERRRFVKPPTRHKSYLVASFWRKAPDGFALRDDRKVFTLRDQRCVGTLAPKHSPSAPE